jgi:Fic family protein
MNSPKDILISLKSEWDSLQPLSPDNDRRLWQKLRLEWNFHSNHIEGNTLTYGETELLLIHGQTHGNHTLREYEEMQAHDVGIAHLRELAEDRTRLIGETDIRNLNKIILKEPFWKPAQTADGQTTRKQIIPGEYKTTPNNVITATGELFEFAPPSDVPARMSSLVEWLEASLHEFRDADLLWLLARLHHDFVLIHPFDDGNGRVARMLVNYVLMRLGYPPVIVPSERKRDYLAALRLADAGDIAELENFLGSCVLRSLELGIKAAKGESLNEPGDVEKEISIFIRGQTIARDHYVTRSSELVRDLYESSFKPLLARMIDKMKLFEPLFARCSVSTEPPRISPEQDVFDVFLSCLERGIENYSYFLIHFEMDGYLGNAPKPFEVGVFVALELSELEYSWKIEGITRISKSYTETILSEEMVDFVDQLQREVFDSIKSKAGTNP